MAGALLSFIAMMEGLISCDYTVALSTGRRLRPRCYGAGDQQIARIVGEARNKA